MRDDKARDVRRDARADINPERTDERLPWNSVVGAMNDRASVDAAIRDLDGAGVDTSSVHVLEGEEGLRLIDEREEPEGVSGLIQRVLHALGDEEEFNDQARQELAAGHFLVVVPSPDDSTSQRVSDVLSRHGGHFINYYTDWTIRKLQP